MHIQFSTVIEIMSGVDRKIIDHCVNNNTVHFNPSNHYVLDPTRRKYIITTPVVSDGTIKRILTDEQAPAYYTGMIFSIIGAQA